MALSVGVEEACLDLVGKLLGTSICQLFGGAVRDRIRLCATRWEKSDDEPAIYAQKARAIAQSGFTAISFDPFNACDRSANRPRLDLAVYITRAIRDAVGTQIDLIADAKGRFTPAQAIAAANALEPFGLMWLKDPLRIAGVASLDMVAKAAKVPVALSARTASNDILRDAIERQLADFVELDPCRVGGISSARNLALLAETYYMGFSLYHAGGPVGMAINALIAACAPNFTVAEVPYPLPPSWGRMMKTSFELQNGCLLIGSGPGWGVELSDEPGDLASRSVA
jgi:L-alanine-DL-glutamate epimerase-like enolase superfamily enzyme